MSDDQPYDDTEREVIAAIEQAQRRHAAMPILITIAILISLGALSAIYSIQGARATSSASTAAVERNAALTRQLTRLTEQYAADQARSDDSAVTFRNDSRRLLLAICDQIEAISAQAHLHVPPCPRVPEPAPGPSPSP